MKDKRLISFSPPSLKHLQAVAAQMEISLSELVRRITDAWLRRNAREKT